MNKAWKPITAGILEILAGIAALPTALYFLMLAVTILPRPWKGQASSAWGSIDYVFALLGWVMPFATGLLGILSIVGGVYALQHRKWGLAYAGAIAPIPLFLWVTAHMVVFVLPLLLLIVAFIFLHLSKREFA